MSGLGLSSPDHYHQYHGHFLRPRETWRDASGRLNSRRYSLLWWVFRGLKKLLIQQQEICMPLVGKPPRTQTKRRDCASVCTFSITLDCFTHCVASQQ
ncbi:hypothetical protein BaRGS_00021556 [Batillaria attramentaria]|uniref:Uncharacterized protein n=1 Tax=Batillaria attramentaria TaxID=370345 RepID=A0ABD0KJ24_9CAEN